MKATTVKSLAKQIGVSVWAIRWALRRGYVNVTRTGARRKIYLRHAEVTALKRHFGVLMSSNSTNTKGSHEY